MKTNTVLLRSGKTKRISGVPPQVVEVHLTDAVTAGDGASRIEVKGKGELSRTIGVNCFNLLRRHGVPTSFISPAGGPSSFTALYTNMAPLEVVVRGIATGSYLKRNPQTLEGHVFESPVVEFFHKDDANHDPIIKPGNSGLLYLYRADMPESKESHLGCVDIGVDAWNLWGTKITDSQLHRLLEDGERLALAAYAALSGEWKKKGFTLVDLKIEIGVCPSTGEVLISDAITPDEWRLWEGGDKAQAFDKDPFRKSNEKNSPELARLIIERYERIADITSGF